ncbi:hypothetical protein CsatB_016238 [Cannabis sativa]
MGDRRSIGDGHSVSILMDSWLPNSINPYAISSHLGLQTKRVSSLFEVGSRTWDMEVLNDLFEARDRDLVVSIQLGKSVLSDAWYWNKESTGFYTVKSAYRLLQQQSSVPDEDDCDGYKSLWQLDIPPKVQHFLWRAVSGCLSTKIQLNTKHVNVDLMCSFCNMAMESIFHILSIVVMHGLVGIFQALIRLVWVLGNLKAGFFSW